MAALGGVGEARRFARCAALKDQVKDGTIVAPQVSFVRALIAGLTGWLRARPAPASPASTSVAPATVDVPASAPIVHDIAERLRQEELASGGWAAEAGGVSPEAYVPDAQRLVRRIALGELQSGPPTP